MTDIAVLQAEIARWEEDFAALADACAAEGWTEPEKLLLVVQRTVNAYRRSVLPGMTANRRPALAAMVANDTPAALSAYSAIVADEIAQLVSHLDELRVELIRYGQTAELQLGAAETLAALRALARVVVRFGQEVEIRGQSGQLPPVHPDDRPPALPADGQDLP